MKYQEIHGDLFSVSKEYSLVHCISSDFALGSGIARMFEQKFCIQKKLFAALPDYCNVWDAMDPKGICIRTGRVLNLVTKRNYWNKPTYETMRTALLSLRECCVCYGIHKIACPLIGCGLDRLQWTEVSNILQEVFCDVDMEIMICKK